MDWREVFNEPGPYIRNIFPSERRLHRPDRPVRSRESPSIFRKQPESVGKQIGVRTKPLARRTLRVRCARPAG